MQQYKKKITIVNVVSFVLATALIALVFLLEVANLNSAKNGEGLLIFFIVVFAPISEIALAISAIMLLISFIGLIKSKRVLSFSVLGIVAKFIASASLVFYAVLTLSAKVPGVATKIFYLIIALAFVVCAIAELFIYKKIENQDSDKNDV